MQNTIVNEIPEPFHAFLTGGEVSAQGVAPPRDGTAGQARNDAKNNQSDLLFLAAILMLCDD